MSKKPTTFWFNLNLLLLLGVAAPMMVLALVHIKNQPRIKFYDGTDVTRVVRECYAAGLAPVIVRNEKNQVTELHCKENN